MFRGSLAYEARSQRVLPRPLFILGGMKPVDAPKTNAGKLFAGCYALYAGLVFIVTAGVAFAPILAGVIGSPAARGTRR